MIVKGVVEGGANTVMLVALGPDGKECGGSWEVPIDMFLVVCRAASAELVTLKSRVTQLEYIAEWAQRMHAMANEVRHQAAVTDPQIAPMAQMAVEGPPEDPMAMEIGKRYRCPLEWLHRHLREQGKRRQRLGEPRCQFSDGTGCVPYWILKGTGAAGSRIFNVGTTPENRLVIWTDGETWRDYKIFAAGEAVQA